MTTVTTPDLQTAEALLERLLTGDSYDRFLAHGEIGRALLGGLTVVDDACHDGRGRPHVFTLGTLWKHLCRLDGPDLVAARNGIRVHTPGNVSFGDRDGAVGPALGTGGAVSEASA